MLLRRSIISDGSRTAPALALAAGLALAPKPAHALEPLSVFLDGATQTNVDAREARATREQREAELDQAYWKLAPTLTAQAIYTRNQYESKVPIPSAATPSVITPLDQGDVFLQASVPLVDVGNWLRIGAAGTTAEAARVREASTGVTVKRQVAQAYYQASASDSLSASARRALATAEQNRALVQARKEAGTASDLDLKRAEAEIESRRQAVTDAELQGATARRQLRSLSGIEPSAGAAPLADDLVPEAPLPGWEGTAEETPAVVASRLEAKAAKRTADAAYAVFAPTLTGSAQERFTNATGFGHSPSYTLSINATLRFDPSLLPAARAQNAAAEAARVRADRASRDAKDGIFNAYMQVGAQIDKAKSARAAEDTSRLAAKLAKARFEAGTASFLDVSLAERDLAAAEAARILTDANLALSRADLRLLSGKSLPASAAPKGGTP